jgi:outer membrane protein assembly factor BamD (BamD/ComL family)
LCWTAVVPAFFQGCSTGKNTGVNRAYHNVTTRYNILFNAKENYRKGLLKAEDSKKDDYTQILPLFLYGDPAVSQEIAGDMGVAAQKVTKAVTLHSITAKPKVGKSGMSPEEKKFYDRREFNKYIDDCYLLIGKIYIYTGEYFFSLRSFNFMETEFPGTPILYESRIWKAKALMLDNNYRESFTILNDLLEDEKFPDQRALKAELEATAADWYIKQKNHAKAISHLEAALSHTKTKKTRMRYLYVLAQLYQEQKDYGSAAANFRKVIRMNPPYDMSFNATISMATASKGNVADTEEIRKQLHKMLRDSKNTDYHDQIYYALAELEMTEGNTRNAIEYYRQSAAASTVNVPQKTKSYLALADLFYERRNYPPAQAYYDSVMLHIQPGYPNYAQIAAKAKNLTTLVENLRTVQFQDSVQRIALMPEADRNRLIDEIIDEKQRSDRAREESEAARLQQYYAAAGRQSALPDARTKAQWYFYNPATVSQGIGEFQTKWGKRNLEDNWRRKNKGTFADLLPGEENAEQDDQEGKVSDNGKREYYLQDLPLTDSLMAASHLKVLEALYTLGYVYNNDFEEYAAAAAQYEELTRRYPQSAYVEASYYYLYLLYTKLGDGDAADRNKRLLLARAPESAFAKIILDPSYLDRLVQEQGEAEKLYEQVYRSYTDGWYEQVVAAAGKAIENYPKDVLRPKFAYLKALSAGKLGTQETMRAEMKKITDEYPDDEVAAAAQDLIDYIDGKDPSLKKAEQAERAKSIYSRDETGTHYFIWIVEAKEDINQLSFDLLNFNLDHYINAKLELSRNAFDDNCMMLVVKNFPDPEQALEYYGRFVKNAGVVKNVKNRHTPVIISENNFMILEKDKKTDDYIEFFKQTYLKQ